MIRNAFILGAVFLAVGLGPALAQELFVRKDGRAAQADEKPTLFVKPAPARFSYPRRQSVVKYKDKLKLHQQQSDNKIIIDSFEEMRALGFKPRTAEDIQAYGQMHRATSQNIMYKRRAALMAYLEKQDTKLQARLAARNFGVFADRDEVASADKQDVPVSEAVVGQDKRESSAARKVIQKPRLFVRRSPEEQALPTRVFKPY